MKRHVRQRREEITRRDGERLQSRTKTLGTFLLWCIVVLAASAQPKGLDTASASSQDVQLVAEIRADIDLVHIAHLGILSGTGNLDAIEKVQYTFLSGGNPRSADPCEPHEPPIRLTREVRERGSGGEGPAFDLYQRLNWLPGQVLAVVSVRGREGRLREVRLEPVYFYLPDPTLDIVMMPEYVVDLIPSPEGLTELPQLQAVEFRFQGHPDRPSAVDRIREIAVGVGTSGHRSTILPLFERFSIEEVRKSGWILKIGSIRSRAQVQPIAHVASRNYLWVQVVDVEGRIESYATWRPSYLPRDIKTADREAALLPARLTPILRAPGGGSSGIRKLSVPSSSSSGCLSGQTR